MVAARKTVCQWDWPVFASYPFNTNYVNLLHTWTDVCTCKLKKSFSAISSLFPNIVHLMLISKVKFFLNQQTLEALWKRSKGFVSKSTPPAGWCVFRIWCCCFLGQWKYENVNKKTIWLCITVAWTCLNIFLTSPPNLFKDCKSEYSDIPKISLPIPSLYESVQHGICWLFNIQLTWVEQS